MSQLALASSSGVSSRHISFIENGRAHPSREVLLRLTHAMNLTRTQENALLAVAGYVSNFRSPPHDQRELLSLRRAFEIIVRYQRPYPAYAIDHAWNVVMSNKSFTTLISWIAGDQVALDKPVNVVRLFLHPDYLRQHVLNWQEVAQTLWHRVRSDLQVPNPHPDTQAIFDEISAYPGMQDIIEKAPFIEDRLLVPIRFNVAGKPMSWFSIIGSLGFLSELSAYQLRIEALFPADQNTDAAISKLMESDSAD